MNWRKLLDYLVPRFITEDVALIEQAEGFEIVCCIADVEPGERFDAVATIRCFNLLGFDLWPKQVGEVRPWPGR
jgi:hypothetical protein